MESIMPPAHSTQISVPMRSSLFIELVDFLRNNSSETDPVEAIEIAVTYWLENAAWKPELIHGLSVPTQKIPPQRQGYYWKDLFLPHGSIIRM